MTLDEARTAVRVSDYGPTCAAAPPVVRAIRSAWEQGECWVRPVHTQNGYGKVRFEGRGYLAHRVTYEHFIGPIPEGHQIDHLCRVRNCVRPDHLEAVTSRENTLRGQSPTGRNAAKTHCEKGHPLQGEHLLVRADGYRACRTCRRENYRKNYDPVRRAARRRALLDARKNSGSADSVPIPPVEPARPSP